MDMVAYTNELGSDMMAAQRYEFRNYSIPPRMMEALRLWIDRGIEPGHFLCAVLTNNLRDAVGRADDENLANLPAFIGYLYNEAPSQCWGSTEKMTAWGSKFADAEQAALRG